MACAKPQTSSGPGPGGRAQEAVQRQTRFLDHVLCLRNTITRRRRRASSPSRSSPTPASLVKTRSRHTSQCRFSFQSECDPKRFDGRSWYEAAKDRPRVWFVGMYRFVFRFCVTLFVRRRAKTAAGRRGAWTLALSEDPFSELEERKKSRAERCRCACQPPNTYSYTRFHFSVCQRYCEQVRLVHLTVIAVPVPQIREQIV